MGLGSRAADAAGRGSDHRDRWSVRLILPVSTLACDRDPGISRSAPCSLITVWNSSRTTFANTIGVALSMPSLVARLMFLCIGAKVKLTVKSR